jgi:hypothetical protein
VQTKEKRMRGTAVREEEEVEGRKKIAMKSSSSYQ